MTSTFEREKLQLEIEFSERLKKLEAKHNQPVDIITSLIQDKLKDNPDISYGEAFSQVQTENRLFVMNHLDELGRCD